jgi:hypothetical protein
MFVHSRDWTLQLSAKPPAVHQGGQQGGPLHILHVPRAARGRAQHRAVDLLPPTHAADKLKSISLIFFPYKQAGVEHHHTQV